MADLRKTFFGISAFVAVVSGSPLQGQSFWRVLDAQYWDGPNLVDLFKNPYREDAGIVYGPGGKLIASVRWPSGPGEPQLKGNLDFLDGTFYFARKKKLAKDDEGRFYSDLEILKYVNQKWEVVSTGRMKGPFGFVIRLGNGNYLAVTAGAAFADEGKSYPFAILKGNEDGKLQVFDRIDAGLKEPFFWPDGSPRYGQLMMPFIAPTLFRVGRHIVFPTPYGIFWIFDGETGKLKSVERFYSSITESDLQGKGSSALLPGLHGAVGTPDGKMLFSCRNEDAVKFGLIGGYPSSSKGPEGLKNWADEVDARYPLVEWWTLDPSNGKFEKEIPPFGLPDRLTSEKELLNFNWFYKPDGTITSLTREQKYKFTAEPTKEAVPKEGEKGIQPVKKVKPETPLKPKVDAMTSGAQGMVKSETGEAAKR